MHINEIKPEWIGIRAVAQYCSVSPKTVWRWVEQGLPYSQRGPRARVLIRHADLDAFLERRCKTGVDLDRMVHQVIGELQSCNDLGAAGVRRHR